MNLTDDRYNFLLKLVYKVTDKTPSDQKFVAAVNVAYTTFCRTVSFGDLKNLENEKERDNIKADLKKKVADSLKEMLEKLKDRLEKLEKERFEKPEEKMSKMQDEFDAWHSQAREKIISIYADNQPKVSLTHGQAQKWINITIKHLYVLDIPEYRWLFEEGVIECLHVAIDNIITKKAQQSKDINIAKPKNSWSSWESDFYEKYQKELREKIKETKKIPFVWEMENWEEEE